MVSARDTAWPRCAIFPAFTAASAGNWTIKRRRVPENDRLSRVPVSSRNFFFIFKFFGGFIFLIFLIFLIFYVLFLGCPGLKTKTKPRPEKKIEKKRKSEKTKKRKNEKT
jgi:hypothetical protein